MQIRNYHSTMSLLRITPHDAREHPKAWFSRFPSALHRMVLGCVGKAYENLIRANFHASFGKPYPLVLVRQLNNYSSR
ncbi:hypothetical protein ABF87_14045 [Nitrosomonas sp. JL21]|nr:hypothetical protein [Nitrosomonas sp. JL21]